MNIVPIIQARMSSSRLPGKVMKQALGKTVLQHVIERVASCHNINDVIVATSINSDDDIIAKEADRLGVRVHRGSLDNVLDRYYHAAKEAMADVVVRITADCPVIDPHVIDRLIQHFTDNVDRNFDYVRGKGFPMGVNAEVFTFSALERSWNEANIGHEFEHVTPYIYTHPEIFTVELVKNEQDLSHLRLTLDTPEDWLLIHTIYERLQKSDTQFILLEEILELFAQEPELLEINQHIKQKGLGD
ncbi:MAG: glycosyltransferase family protein [Gammaproteobacteria bacterium]|nr:glycosyltransferase family protein [Gammaproteobacteria bacterium]